MENMDFATLCVQIMIRVVHFWSCQPIKQKNINSMPPSFQYINDRAIVFENQKFHFARLVNVTGILFTMKIHQRFSQ